MIASMIVPREARAAPDYPKVVRGYIWDSAHSPVNNAQVTVQSVNGTTVIDTQTDTTDATGYYLVTFLVGKWDSYPGNHFDLVATCPSGQDDNSTIAAAGNYQELNLTFLFEIPEFGGTAGLLLTAGIVGGVAAVAVVWVRRR